MSERLAALAMRVRDEVFFLASALSEYARSENLEEPGLMMLLNCSSDTLTRLRLCRRPRPDAPHFMADVDRIASRFDIQAEILAEIVRRADALVVLRRASDSNNGVLKAARDRDALGKNESGDVGEKPGHP